MEKIAYMSEINPQSLADLIFNCNKYAGFRTLVCIQEHGAMVDFLNSMKDSLQILPTGNVIQFANGSSIRVISQYDLSALKNREFNAVLVDESVHKDNLELMAYLSWKLDKYDSTTALSRGDTKPDYYIAEVPDDQRTDAECVVTTLEDFLSEFAFTEESNAGK